MPFVGFRHSKETKEKLSKRFKGVKLSEETKLRMRGRKCSIETKRKMSEAHKGRKITWGDKISEALLGKKFSPEHRAAISKGHIGQTSWCKGKKFSKEYRKKLSIAHLGQICWRKGKKFGPLSQEIKNKISKSNKNRIISPETRERIRLTLTGRKRPEMCGNNNPMHTHPNAYKSKWGKTGYRKDLGLFVKSTWEANILRIFNYLGLFVQYEPQSFMLSNGRSYRPDFYILNTSEVIEIKGFCREKDKERIKLFREEYPELAFDFIGPEKYYQYRQEFEPIIKNWE